MVIEKNSFKKRPLGKRLSGKFRSIIMFLFVGILLLKPDITAVAAEGVFTATANPYYKHPVTGVIEDAGNNEGIGQGMTESVLNPTALIEETSGGEIYVTVRYYLAEYISDIKFWTQKREDTTWEEASYTIMQENVNGEYCTDYRLKIPAKDAIVKSSFFVSPMGRDVIFYMDFSDFKEGSGDFIVSQDGKENTQENIEDAKEASIVTAVTTEKSSAARELIDSADGLVLSDTENAGNTASDTTDTVSDVTDTVTAERQVKAGNTIPALSWILVLQCILIITLPPFITGTGLLLVIKILRKGREEN